MQLYGDTGWSSTATTDSFGGKNAQQSVEDVRETVAFEEGCFGCLLFTQPLTVLTVLNC